ncbi:MAG: alpha/beta hydrolase [Bermanella sp.]
MKSSSALFPVALMRAEALSSEFIEDTYLLKPNNSPDVSAQIALSRLGYYENQTASRGMPVILVHGAFSNRGIWLDSHLHGAARILLESGFDPWMLELRGHGDSPENAFYHNNSLEQYAEFDLPAVQAFVKEQTKQKTFWVGHSSGGVCIATALSGKHLSLEDVAGTALFGTQVSKYPAAIYLPFVRTIIKIWLSTKKRLSNHKLGPEVEPNGIGFEFIRWSGLFTRWKSKKGVSFWQGLKDVNVPVIGFGAKKDKGDPAKYCEKLINAFAGDKSFHLLAKTKGYSKDYGHGDMVKSDSAFKEVWPLLITWLEDVKHNKLEERK